MCAVVLQESDVRIPDWVCDLESFRRWADADDFPETGRVCYLKGEVWVDMSKEQMFSHVKVKAKIGNVLEGIVEAGELGHYFADGVRLSNLAADISAVPDGSFFSNESLRTGRVRLVPGAAGGFVEVEGSPDMVLEVVSDSSVRKDNVILFGAYGDAGVREYWLVDARQDPLRFDVYKHTRKGYVTTRKQGGWVKSAVFGKSFRLTRQDGKDGFPVYGLEVRSTPRG